MPTIMSQNVVRPEDYKADTASVSEMPLSSMDSHHLRDLNNGNGRILQDSTTSDSSQVAAMAAVTATSKQLHITSSSGSRHHTKTRPLAIQTTSLHTIGKSIDSNNSNSHPNTANTESTPSSTTAIPASSSSPPPSTASSTSSSSTTNSPMSHIRRWTSSLSSSSKSNSKGSTKVRTIGPIGAPQPLTTPVPYACTPLPYSDLPSPDHFSIAPSSSLPSAPRVPLSDSTVPRSPAKPATSCPDLPVNSHTSEHYLNLSTPTGSYSSLNRNQRTSWKDRLFNSNPKKQDRRASTNSNVDDDYEWSSNQDADTGSISAAPETGAGAQATPISTTTSPLTTSTVATSTEKPRPKMRISPPLTQPVLPANQKTVPIMQNPLVSPTDDLFGPDTFDPFKIAPKSKATSSEPASMMMMMTAPAEKQVLPSATTSPSLSSAFSTSRASIDQSSRPTVNIHIKPSAAPVQQLLTPPSSHSSEDSFPFLSPSSSSSFDEDRDESAGTEAKRGKATATPEVAVLDFAASLCEGLVSDFVMPPSYFDQHSLSLAFEDAYPRADPDMMPKVAATSPPSSPPSSRSSLSPRSSRGSVSLKDRSSKSSSTYSTDSDSSTSSTDSDDSTSSSESSLSPVSGASFFSSPITTVSSIKSSNLSSALMKSGGIRIPTSLMTLLPTSSLNKSKAIPVSPSTTPPVSPPLVHAEVPMTNLTPGAAQAPPAMIVALADPRAMMLKRLAYIHTLRKLRERERRPFRHAVLLHLILLQLRRGITNRHCGEIAEFYVAMSAAQFPPRLDLTNTMVMAQQQRTKLQQQQQLLSQQSSLSQIPFLSSSASAIESVQESMIPVRSSSKAVSISPAGASGDKEPKSKRSLVFSLQSRSQANKASSSNSNTTSGESGWSLASTSSAAAATTSAPSQISAFKDRLPLLRIPAYPLINLEKNNNSNNNSNTNNVLTSSPARKNLAAVAAGNDISSEDDSNGIEDSNVDFQPVIAQPVPTVILPKRTTGRKGLLYQQQLQLRMRQQLPMMVGGANQPLLMPGGLSEQEQARLQSQLAGSRPRFATSTFTTVRSGRSDVVTRPLIPLESVKPISNSAPESSSTWSSFPFSPFSHRSGVTTTATTTAAGTTTSTGSTATTAATQDGSRSPLPAGLLTPPLSPLFRNPFSSAAPSNATAAPTSSTGSGKPNDNSTNTTSNTSNSNSSIPPPLPSPTSSTTSSISKSNKSSMRLSYSGQGHHSLPTSSMVTFPTHHARVSSAGSVSSYTSPHIQNSHHTISYLEGQAVHARSRSSHEGNSALPPSSAAAAAASSLSRKTSAGGVSFHQQQMGLLSPPLSPTLDTDGHSAAAMLSTVTASMIHQIPAVQSAKRAHKLPQRSLSSNGYIHYTHGHGMNAAAVGGRSENIAWIMRVPSPVSHQHQQQQQQQQQHHHELHSRHSMEDMRNRRHWKSSSSSTSSTSSSSSSSSSGTVSAPIVVSAAAASTGSVVTIGSTPLTSRKGMKKAKAGGVFSPEESEEEDVPLAYVQRRISSDTLRSMA